MPRLGNTRTHGTPGEAPLAPPLAGAFFVDGARSDTDCVDPRRGGAPALAAGNIDFELWLPSGDVVHGTLGRQHALSHIGAYQRLLAAANLDAADPDFWGAGLEPPEDPDFVEVYAWRNGQPDDEPEDWIKLDLADGEDPRRCSVSNPGAHAWLEVRSNWGRTFFPSPGALTPVRPAKWAHVFFLPFKTDRQEKSRYGVHAVVADWVDVCAFHASLENRADAGARVLGRAILDRVMTDDDATPAHVLAAAHCQLEHGGLRRRDVAGLSARVMRASKQVRAEDVPDFRILERCLSVHSGELALKEAGARLELAKALAFDNDRTPFFTATARLAERLAVYVLRDLDADDPVAKRWRDIHQRFSFVLAETGIFQYEGTKPGQPGKSSPASAGGAKKKSDPSYLGRWPSGRVP